MKQIKKTLAFILSVLVLFTATPIMSVLAETDNTTEEDIIWTLIDGVLIISGTGVIEANSWHAPDVFRIVIREGITGIGDDAFSECTSLTGVMIPDGVTSIGEDAFRNCSSLTGIVIPDSVITIEDGAFYGCKKLTSFTIPTGVTEISDHTFNMCTGLTSVTLPKGITKIGNCAFYGTNLSNIIIPDGVTRIGDNAFCGCDKLNNIVIPNSVTSIGLHAFEGCRALTDITIPDSVTYIGSRALWATGYKENSENWENGALYVGNHLIEAKKNIGGYYIVRPGTKTIAGLAFEDCVGLTSIIIPDGVVTIGEWAFSGCANLTEIHMPDTVTCIKEYAFNNTGYYNVYSNWENGVLYVGNHLIKAEGSIEGNYVVRPGTKTIAGNAFSYCRGLTSITIPDGVASIGTQAFDNCGIKSITIPTSVTSMGELVFGKKVTIEGYSGTAAEAYAKENNMEFVSLGVYIVSGDLDGQEGITAADALMALQAATGKINLDETATTAADVDGQAGITANDALLILQYATKKITAFPIAG